MAWKALGTRLADFAHCSALSQNCLTRPTPPVAHLLTSTRDIGTPTHERAPPVHITIPSTLPHSNTLVLLSALLLPGSHRFMTCKFPVPVPVGSLLPCPRVVASCLAIQIRIGSGCMTPDSRPYATV